MMEISNFILFIVIFGFYFTMICLKDKKKSKISLKEILNDVGMLKKSNGKISWIDIFIFIIFPAVLSYILVCVFKIKIDIAKILTFVTLVSALLLNFWIIMLSINHKRKDLLKEVNKNIVKNIFITIILFIITLMKDINISDERVLRVINIGCIYNLFKCIYIFLVIQYIIMFIMILQRVYIMSETKNDNTN